MRVQADVEAIKTQLQLYESMNAFYPTTEQGLQAMVTQPDKDPRPARWYQLFKELPKIPGATITFIAALVSKTRAAMTCIPPGRIGRVTLQTTIWAAVNPTEVSNPNSSRPATSRCPLGSVESNPAHGGIEALAAEPTVAPRRATPQVISVYLRSELAC
jgi:hypothetical protein